MNKLLIPFIAVAAAIILVGVGLLVKQSGGNPVKKENAGLFVPLPTSPPKVEPTTQALNQFGISQQSIVEVFLKAISDGKPSEAVMMMTAATTGNDANKQATAVQYNIFKKFVVKSIEPIMKENWTDTFQEYEISVDVEIKPNAAIDSPIPNYGWENGNNVRFVGIEKVGSEWKIQGIATGP